MRGCPAIRLPQFREPLGQASVERRLMTVRRLLSHRCGSATDPCRRRIEDELAYSETSSQDVLRCRSAARNLWGRFFLNETGTTEIYPLSPTEHIPHHPRRRAGN